MSKCQKCGNEVQEDAVFCDQCGARLTKPEAAQPAQPVAVIAPTESAAPVAAAPVVAVAPSTGDEAICPSCGTHNTPGEAFCQDCGTKLAAPAPTAISPVAAPTSAAEADAANKCPDCGASTGGSEEFCFACGADLKSARQRAASQVQAAVQPKAEPVAESTQPAIAKVEPPASVAPAAVPPVAAPAAAQAPEASAACSTCGAKVKDGDTFCEACGAALTATPSATTTNQPEATVVAATVTPAASAPVTRLVVVASGAEIPLAGRNEIVVGREDPYSGMFPDVDLTPHGGVDGGVSRRHFKITVAGSQYRIEDLNSTNYTLVNRKRLQPGAAQTLADGDEISAGRVKLIFRLTA